MRISVMPWAYLWLWSTVTATVGAASASALAPVQLTSSQHQHADLAAHRQVLQDVNHLGVAQRLDVLPVDLLDDVALQQAATPLGVENHLHLLAQGTVCDGEAKTCRAFHQLYAH